MFNFHIPNDVGSNGVLNNRNLCLQPHIVVLAQRKSGYGKSNTEGMLGLENACEIPRVLSITVGKW
jgi:hypothetical protein